MQERAAGCPVPDQAGGGGDACHVNVESELDGPPTDDPLRWLGVTDFCSQRNRSWSLREAKRKTPMFHCRFARSQDGSPGRWKQNLNRDNAKRQSHAGGGVGPEPHRAVDRLKTLGMGACPMTDASFFLITISKISSQCRTAKLVDTSLRRSSRQRRDSECSSSDFETPGA